MLFNRILLDEQSELIYYPAFINKNESVQFFERLRNEINWKREKIKIFGKEYWQPRLLAWYGDAQAQYRYSGIDHQPQKWTETLLNLKIRIEDVSNSQFNSVLTNLYRDGNDSMGWHSDDERELGIFPTIASLSFGESRRFCLRPKKGRAGDKFELLLGCGDLILMKGAVQDNFQHAVPKTAKEIGERINLTFRLIKK